MMQKIKRLSIFFLVLCLLLSFLGCGASDELQIEANGNGYIDGRKEIADSSANSEEIKAEESNISSSENIENYSTETNEEINILIAYFSRADENYGVGYIEKGNTAIIAEMIAEETGGELFHIERGTPYPASYDECTEEAKQEQNANARPVLAEDKDISEYDVIFLGYPIWWGEMPMPVYTFLEGHDFSGKTIIPFCTHAGSGLSGTENNIKSVCADSEILNGLSVNGEDAQNSQDKVTETVNEWLEKLSY